MSPSIPSRYRLPLYRTENGSFNKMRIFGPCCHNFRWCYYIIRFEWKLTQISGSPFYDYALINPWDECRGRARTKTRRHSKGFTKRQMSSSVMQSYLFRYVTSGEQRPQANSYVVGQNPKENSSHARCRPTSYKTIETVSAMHARETKIARPNISTNTAVVFSLYRCLEPTIIHIRVMLWLKEVGRE